MGSRTELDWAARNRQIAVWAPSKMVLDAVDGASIDPRDAAALVGWFAAIMQAQELICIGTAMPDSAGLSVRSVPDGAHAIF